MYLFPENTFAWTWRQSSFSLFLEIVSVSTAIYPTASVICGRVCVSNKVKHNTLRSHFLSSLPLDDCPSLETCQVFIILPEVCHSRGFTGVFVYIATQTDGESEANKETAHLPNE